MIKTTTCIVMSAPFALGSSAAAVCVGVGFIRSLRTSRETRSLVDSTPRGWALLYQYTHLKIVEKSKLSCDLFFTNRSLKPNTTLNNGYLGSRNDEERNQMRYVMRSVQLVSHRIFERTLRSRLRPRACLPERQPNPSSPNFGLGAWTWPSRKFVAECPGRLKRRGAGV